MPKLPSIYVLPSEQTHVVKQVGDHRWPAKHVAKPTRSTVIVRPAQHPAKAEQCREDEPCDVTVNTEELLAQ